MLIDVRAGVVESEMNLSNWNSSVMSWSVVETRLLTGRGLNLKKATEK